MSIQSPHVSSSPHQGRDALPAPNTGAPGTRDDNAIRVLVDRLRARHGDRISVSEAVREQHGRDESHHSVAPPDAVFFARSTEDVADAVSECARLRIPVIPFGTGTALEGHVAAIHGGLCIDLGQMNRILRVSASDMDCTVEAGVTRKLLNAHLRDTGLFFPVDPGADASLGGMAATRASGTNAVRYGTMRDNVLSLKVVTGDGRVITTAKRARKSAAGYDMTRLFVGSEGTLGVITELTLRLHGVPEATAVALCSFPNLEDAVNAVIVTVQLGVQVARIELLDEVQVDACNRYSNLSLPRTPLLLFEFHGTEAAVREQSALVEEISKEHNGHDFHSASSAEDRSRLWAARHDALYASKAMRLGCTTWATDVCVPISRLADCLVQTKSDIVEAGLLAPIVGHVGDGNFHVTFVLDPAVPEEWDLAREVNGKMIARAIAMDGTCTGEHGIGLGKIDCLADELGDAVSLMRAVKRAIDPQNLMNPGKVFRVEGGAGA